MDVVLRFASLRSQDATTDPAVTLTTASSFQSQVRDSLSDPGSESVAVARRFVETDFVRDADHAVHGRALTDVVRRIREGELTHDQLGAAVRQTVGEDDPASFAAELTRARDSVLAAYLLPEHVDATAAQELVRGYTLAEAVLAGRGDEARARSIVSGPMALPDFVAPPPSSAAGSTQPTPEERARELAAQINELAQRRARLAGAIAELSLHGEDELELSELGERRPLRDLYRAALPEQSERELAVREGDDRGSKIASGGFDDRGVASPLLRATVGRNVSLSARALEVLPDQVTETMRALALDPATASVEELHQRVTAEHAQVTQQLMSHAVELARFRPGGGSLVGVIADWLLDPVDDPDRPPPVASAAPTTHTAIRPLGVADLVLVRAHIERYERAEVALVENVLPHEKLTHTTRRLDTVETSTTDEQEATDLRSQMQTTAEQTNETAKVEAVGPGLGPLAAAGPVTFAKTVTDQVSSQTTTRARRVTLVRQVRETEETLEHVVDDTAAAKVEYGVYQWLDKIYAARAYTFGARLLYDVIVPEPAALFRDAIGRPRSGLPAPVRPAPFKLEPSDLTADNWAYYAGGHHASGVDAPPAAQVVVTEPFAARSKDSFASDSTSNTVVLAEARSTRLPKGYGATSYRVVVQGSAYDAGFVSVSVGGKSFTIQPVNGVFFRSGRLAGETETLPVAVEIDSNGVDWGIHTITVGVEIVCSATDELMAAWQTRTHAQILEANQQRFRDYEEQAATRAATARAFLQALGPAQKAAVVRTEMERAALELLTGQSFSGFNATAVDSGGFPYPDPGATAALSAYTRFFQQAIEWDRLAYVFYPYFWGSQRSWVAKLVDNEPDAQFAKFLGSGAARVVLPVGPGYEAAVERFLNTGVTPTTDELLDVGSPLWVSLVDELRRDGAEDGTEREVGTPWEFRIASDLVWARPDGSIPRWKRVQDAWRDEADPGF